MISSMSTETREGLSPCDLLFIHGNMASKKWWYPVIESLQTQFKKKFSFNEGKILLGELPGHGQSPMEKNSPLSVENIVANFILATEQAGLKKTLIIGHSAGGLISALLLARRPDLYRGAILIDPVGPQGLTNVPPDIEARYAMMTGQRALATQIVGATIYNNNADGDFFKKDLMDDAMIALDHCGVRLVQALMGLDYRDEIANIQKPVRVYYGEKDWVLPAESARAYVQLIADAEIVFLPENGHCLNVEDPEKLATEIVAFIEEELL